MADSQIVHSPLHPHPLEFKVPYGADNGFVCNACNEEFDGSRKAYHCDEDGFDLCENCFTSLEHKVKEEMKQPTVEVNIPLHIHPLKLMAPYGGQGWSCDVCREDYPGVLRSYHCVPCGFDLCKNCHEENEQKMKAMEGAAAPITLPVHEHPLWLMVPYEGGGWSCDRCSEGNPGEAKSFHCTPCGYDLCRKCAEQNAPAGMVLPSGKPDPAGAPAAPAAVPEIPPEHKFEPLKFFRRYCRVCQRARAAHAVGRLNLFKANKLEDMTAELVGQLWDVYDIDHSDVLETGEIKLLVTDYYEAFEERIPEFLKQSFKGANEGAMENHIKIVQDHFKKVPIEGISTAIVRDLDPQQSGGVKKETFLSSVKEVMGRWDPFRD